MRHQAPDLAQIRVGQGPEGLNRSNPGYPSPAFSISHLKYKAKSSTQWYT